MQPVKIKSVHPFADAYPMLSGEELAAMADDISRNGQRVRGVVTPDGVLIDGRNRRQACELAGVEFEFDVVEVADPIAYIESLNEHRRSQTSDQKAAVAFVAGCDSQDVNRRLRGSFAKLSQLQAEGFDLSRIVSGEIAIGLAMRELAEVRLERTKRELGAWLASADAPEPAPKRAAIPDRAYVQPNTKLPLMYRGGHATRAANESAGRPRRHLVIPDTQVRPGTPLVHFRWIARYVAAKRPEVLVHLGDHFDLPSLSSYDKGKAKAEGRRLQADIAAGVLAMRIFRDELAKAAPGYKPEVQLMLTGNHEERLARHIDACPELEGSIGYEDFAREEYGWSTAGFLDPVDIDGVRYCHYLVRNTHGQVVQSKRGMPSAREQVKREGVTSITGHKQGLDVHCQAYQDALNWGIIAGSCYLHDENYLTPQGTHYWRGIVVLNHVQDGNLSPWFVDLDYLCRRFEGKTLREFMTTATDSQLLTAP